MPDYFYDTSALVKRYHTELGTDNVDLIFADPTATHTVSQLAAVELLSAFAIKVRMGAVPASSILAASAKFQSDLAGRIIRVLRMRDEHYRIAEELLMRHSVQPGLRTLDALHVAVALDLHQQRQMTHLVAADLNVCAVALAEGLSVINPERP
jgi:uncharacterized protein